MEKFENLSQEELLQAAQEAYENQLNQQQENSPDAKDPSLDETTQQPAQETRCLENQDDQTQPEEEAPLEEEDKMEEVEELDEETPPLSTTFTAMGIGIGLVVGAAVGFATDMVPACLTLGILLGVTLGLLFDVKKDKKQNPAPEKQENEFENLEELAMEDQVVPHKDQDQEEF